jgi:beta-glucanase (GH16 family)
VISSIVRHAVIVSFALLAVSPIARAQTTDDDSECSRTETNARDMRDFCTTAAAAGISDVMVNGHDCRIFAGTGRLPRGECLPNPSGVEIAARGSTDSSASRATRSRTASSSSQETPVDSAAPTDVIWSDEFNGPAGSKPGAPWRFFNAWGKGKWRDAIYSDDYARMDGDGHLVITGEMDGDKLRTSYLQTYDAANPAAPGAGKFGPGTKIEARIDFSGIENPRTWGAFWSMDPIGTYDGDPENGMEIDIVEVPRMAQGPNGWIRDKYTVGTHWSKEKGGGASKWIDRNTDGFHTYGLEWTKDKLTWTFDGEPVWETTQDVSRSNNQALILSMEHANTSGPWGAVDADNGRSSRMVIDWVRVSALN